MCAQENICFFFNNTAIVCSVGCRRTSFDDGETRVLPLLHFSLVELEFGDTPFLYLLFIPRFGGDFGQGSGSNGCT